MMNSLSRFGSILAISGLILAGCQTTGSGASAVVELQADATPLTTAELYNYFAEQTQRRSDGGIYYTGFGTLVSLEDGKRYEGTWGSYDGGKICHHFEDREDKPCEIYYHNAGAVSVAMQDKIMAAPKLLKGDQLDLLETGTARKLYNKEQTTLLVSGKTVLWEDSNGAYYSPDGKLITLWDGEKESGKWSVNDKGAVCWHVPSWGASPCESYFSGLEGLMAVYKGEESLADEHREGNVLDSM